MRLRRRLLIPLSVVLIVAGVALIIFLRKQAPPEAARLLPGADGFFYIDLTWIRRFNAAGQLPAISREPEYQKFVDETGFEFERDLDQAAFAIHYPRSWGEGTGGAVAEPRFSEVFVGKIDFARFNAYLKKLSSSVDNYRGFEIFNIPFQGRTVRVVRLSYDSVAVSNHPDPEVIRGMLDRSRKLASPFAGPWLLRNFYKRVPLASLCFAILRVRPEMNSMNGLGSWSLLFPKPAVAVISARYLPSLKASAIHLRAEAFTDSEEDARDLAEKTSAFLSLFRAAEGTVGSQGTDADVKAFFNSLKVEQTKDRAMLTAIVPEGFIRKVLTDAPESAAPAVSGPPAKGAPVSKERKPGSR